MIKNNSFYKVWFVLIGIMVANVPCLYGAEPFEIFTFLQSNDTPNSQEAISFTNYLETANQDCEKSTLQNTNYCEFLAEILKEEKFVNKCESILGNPKVDKRYKKNLARTYFEIKFNKKIKDPEINLPMSPLIKSNLSPAYLLTFEVNERKPNQWIEFSPYKKVNLSISAIQELDKIITDHQMSKAEASSDLLRKNILGYLTYLSNFFKTEPSDTSKKTTSFFLEANKDSLINLIKITANDEIKNMYDLLKLYVPSLPSLQELFPKPATPQASPAQPIKNPKLEQIFQQYNMSDYTELLDDLNSLIKLSQIDKNLNRSLMSTDTFAKLWKTIVDAAQDQTTHKLYPVFKQLFSDPSFKTTIEKIITDEPLREKSLNFLTVLSFENVPEGTPQVAPLTFDVEPQQVPQPAAPTLLQPLVSQASAIAAAQHVQPQIQSFNQPQPLNLPPSATKLNPFSAAKQQWDSMLAQQQQSHQPPTYQPVQTQAFASPLSPDPSASQQPFVKHQKMFSDKEIEKLNEIRESNKIILNTNTIDALFRINQFFHAGKLPTHFNSLWIPSVKTLALYKGEELKPYIKRIVETPDFQTINNLIINQEPAIPNKQDFIQAYTRLEQSLLAPSPTNQMPVQTNTPLTAPLSGRKNIPNFSTKRQILKDHLNNLNNQIKAFSDKKLASQNLGINTIINSILNDQDTVDSISPIDFFKLSRLLNYLGKNTRIPQFIIQPIYRGPLTADDLRKIQPPQHSLALANVRNINKFFTDGCRGIKSFTNNVIQLANSSERYHSDGILEGYINKIANDDFFRNICLFIMNGYDYSDKQDFVKACAKLNPDLVPKQAVAPKLAAVQPFVQPTKAPAGANQPVSPATPLAQKTGAPVQQPQPATKVQPVVQQIGAPVQQPQPSAASNNTAGDSEPWFFTRIVSGIGSAIGSVFTAIGSILSGIWSAIFGG